MGAPLTPAFHNEYMSQAKVNRAIVNIGGITNVTLLPAKGKILGWDIGPGNCLIDQAVKNLSNGKQQFDNKGTLAKKGNPQVLENTIKKFLNTSYFKKPIPKSQSVENYDLKKFRFDSSELKKLKDEDLISGLTEITFQSILRDLQKYCKKKYEIYFCGGGTKNNYLMDRFQELNLENMQFFKTSELGIDPLDVEAMTFAWLAKKRLEKQKIDLTSVTGSKPSLMGEIIN
jgi:anhydro-N-acetylmuramic acid kinase